MRRAVALSLVGITLGVVTVVGLSTRPRDIGVPPGAVDDVTTSTSTPTTLAPPTSEPVPTTLLPPLWTANESSLLTDLAHDASAIPTRLVIDALDLDAPIGPYGVDANGQMEVPDNVTEVGWYEHGPSPGEPGSAVLAAHVDLQGPGRGIFYDLEDLQVGDIVQVGYEDGSISDFEVVARSTYLKTELPLEVIFDRQGDPLLTLVTCGGGFSQSERSYDSNVVVYASPLGGGT
ncbi:MAG TPA: class F sortase [Acidimicrobiia bacterium]|nr:class F sortase [Acidimicrobiia bacterium]